MILSFNKKIISIINTKLQIKKGEKLFCIFYYLHQQIAIIFIKLKILYSFNLLIIRKIYLINIFAIIFYKKFFFTT